MRPDLASIDDATWIALVDVETAGKDRMSVFGAGTPAAAILHLSTLSQIQTVSACFAGDTITKTQTWSTPDGMGGFTTVGFLSWVNVRTPVDAIITLCEDDGSSIGPPPSCAVDQTQPDPPAGWDLPPEGYNGPGQPTAGLSETTAVVEEDAPTPEELFAACTMGAGSVAATRYVNSYNKRTVWQGKGWSGGRETRVGNVPVGLMFSSHADSFGAIREKRTLTFSIHGHRVPCDFFWTITTTPDGGSPTTADFTSSMSKADGWETVIVLEPGMNETVELSLVAIVPKG